MWIEDFYVSKREVLFSVVIICIMLMFGVLIGGSISDAVADQNEIYNKALKVESPDMFEYGMRTNIGNAFVYGDLIAVDTVSYPAVDGEYMYIRKVTEKYTKHYRTVTKTRTNSDGETETYTEIEEYWTWDEIDRESQVCSEVTFLNVTFPSNKIDMPGAHGIDIIYKGFNDIRYIYSGVDPSHTGTIFTVLSDGTISDNSQFFKDADISEAIERIRAVDRTIVFWVIWIFLTGVATVMFWRIENDWLE